MITTPCAHMGRLQSMYVAVLSSTCTSPLRGGCTCRMAVEEEPWGACPCAVWCSLLLLLHGGCSRQAMELCCELQLTHDEGVYL